MSTQEFLQALREGNVEKARQMGIRTWGTDVIDQGPVAVQTFLEAFPLQVEKISVGMDYLIPGQTRSEEIQKILKNFDFFSRLTPAQVRDFTIDTIVSGNREMIRLLDSKGVFRRPDIREILSTALTQLASKAKTSPDVIRWLVSSGA